MIFLCFYIVFILFYSLRLSTVSPTSASNIYTVKDALEIHVDWSI